MNNKEAGIKLIDAAAKAPNGGVYGDPTFYDAYIDLIRSLGELIPIDSSHGALQNKVGHTAIARCKLITAKAKAMEDIMKSICQR